MPIRRTVPTRAAATAAAALLLASCATGPADPHAGDVTATGVDGRAGSASSSPDVPAGLEEFYDQEVSWAQCAPSGSTCGTVRVPLDYADPGGRTLDLHVKRGPQPEGARGALLVNPGGPGGEAASMVDQATAYFTEPVRDAYQIVAVDPRGVGRSQPVDCVDDPELDTVLAATFDTSTPAGVDAYLTEVEGIADRCAQESGVELLAHVSTQEAARDMDVVRGVLGQERLDYLGFSYGTFLGAAYAHLFPQNVGRMVLDGGMDPTLSNHEVVLGQATGFESALHAWAENCVNATQGCPVSGTPDEAVAQVDELLEKTTETPLPSDSGRSVTGSLATMGVLTPLYSELSWPALTQALSQAFAGDGTALLALADLGTGRQADGTYRSNTNEALWAINCRDHLARGDREQWRADAQELETAAPTFGSSLTYTDALCTAWPQEAAAQEPIGPMTAPEASPILVVGTTGDPATPYAWSESLVGQLGGDARLLTVEGHGHTAYNAMAPQCVQDAVDGYLVEGTLPEDGARCDV